MERSGAVIVTKMLGSSLILISSGLEITRGYSGISPIKTIPNKGLLLIRSIIKASIAIQPIKRRNNAHIILQRIRIR